MPCRSTRHVATRAARLLWQLLGAPLAAAPLTAALLALAPGHGVSQTVSTSTLLRVDPSLNRRQAGSAQLGASRASDGESAGNFALNALATARAGAIGTFAQADSRASNAATGPVFSVIGVANASSSDTFVVRAGGAAGDRILLDFAISATGSIGYAQSGNEFSSFGGLVKYDISVGGASSGASVSSKVERGRRINSAATRATGRLVMEDYEEITGPGLNVSPATPTMLTVGLAGARETIFRVTMSSEVIASVKGSSNEPGSFMSASADFGHTLRWLGLARASLPDGTPYTGELVFSSTSGFDYGQAVATVPEPAPMALLALGLGLLAWRSRARRSAA